jgi:electron transport complex protein RnfB
VSDSVYRRLAERLNEIPNGFPATASGVELELLAKVFTEDEARIAGVMRLGAEPVSAIAERAGVDESAAARALKRLAKKGLVRGRRSEGRFLFGLKPFIVGIYEAHLPRMDRDFALLFERYFQETRGGTILGDQPPLHRVIPVDRAIPVEIEVFPYERASQVIEEAKSWGVRDCVCRVQQKLIGKGCEHRIENCIMYAPVEHAFDSSEATRAITKDEALTILREAAEAGLVHSTMNTRDESFYICNCCTCCCAVLRGVAEFGQQAAVARSGFRARVDDDACTACGTCVERCQFGALSVDGTCVTDPLRCVGCGLCVPACPVGALELERAPRGEAPVPPADERDWLVRRARERGMSLEDIL